MTDPTLAAYLAVAAEHAEAIARARQWVAEYGPHAVKLSQRALVAIDDAMHALADTQEATVGHPTEPVYGDTSAQTLADAVRPRPEPDEPGTVTVNADVARTIVDWWRAANEAPGGCSPAEAIDGMRDAVFALNDALDPPQPCGAWVAGADQGRECTLTGEHDVHADNTGWRWSS